GDRVDVGGLAAETPAATDALVDALLEHGRAILPVSGLLYERAPGLADALTRRGVELTRYSYLSADPGSIANRPPSGRCAGPGVRFREWSLPDLDVTAHLLHAAHDETTAVLPSCSGHSDWRRYLTNLALYDGCGTLAPSLSLVACAADRPVGVALVSRIAERTAHLVQCAVHPDHQ